MRVVIEGASSHIQVNLLGLYGYTQLLVDSPGCTMDDCLNTLIEISNPPDDVVTNICPHTLYHMHRERGCPANDHEAFLSAWSKLKWEPDVYFFIDDKKNTHRSVWCSLTCIKFRILANKHTASELNLIIRDILEKASMPDQIKLP